MKPHHAIIRQGLQELSNAIDSSRKCRVTFTANRHEHWLQCTPVEISMDWPFSAAPAQNQVLRSCFGSAGPVQILEWEMDSFVTFAPAVQHVDELVAGIDRVFRELYDLGPDYALAYQLEDG